jgi:hypothetical protein
MTKLEQALAAHQAVVDASPDMRDDAYRALFRVLCTFEMAGVENSFFALPPTPDRLVNVSPFTQMVSIIADLTYRGIRPPQLAGDETGSINERFVLGLIAKLN